MSVWKKITRKLAESGMMPHTRLAWFTLYLAAVEATLILVKWLLQLSGARSAAAPLSGWIGFLAFVLGILGLFLALRWFRIHVMWSVRNRLIVTYLFIGGVPVTLVLLMAAISAYFLVGQFAASLPISAIQAELKHLQTVNLSAVRIVARRAAAGDRPLGQSLPDDPTFPGKTVQVDDDASRPSWLADGFNNLVLDQNRLYLRAANILDVGGRKLTVISSVPVDEKFLARITAEFGQVKLYIPKKNEQGNVDLTIAPGRGTVVTGAQSISAGAVGLPQTRWDLAFDYHALIQPLDWETGKPLPLNSFLTGTTRLSVLYTHLSGAMSQWTSILLIALTALAIAFGVIVLIALIIGIRLTRTVTYSVANLYKATQHINRGDFDYRIQVREKDQLAALQLSFNSMAQSLQKLIAEQKEKERLQSELEIAHEVQAQLFPRDVSGTRTLEMHGICRPARIVSGDYYDFLSLGADQAGIAVGDISGKGISAALLMATIHSAVRAYQQEATVSVREVSAYGTTGRISGVTTRVGLPSPAQMLWLLNHHLYQTTQPEKYATLFLGFYDGGTRRFTYSNAGHLAPIILGRNGAVRRLEAGGMVVGLFDHMEYAEETVELYPGDIFIAFSDGMTEPENEFGEFGEERLLETIVAHRNLPLEHISAQAVSAVQDWIGSAEQPDDITLVLARPAAPDVI